MKRNPHLRLPTPADACSSCGHIYGYTDLRWLYRFAKNDDPPSPWHKFPMSAKSAGAQTIKMDELSFKQRVQCATYAHCVRTCAELEAAVSATCLNPKQGEPTQNSPRNLRIVDRVATKSKPKPGHRAHLQNTCAAARTNSTCSECSSPSHKKSASALKSERGHQKQKQPHAQHARESDHPIILP